MPWNCILFKTE